MTFNVNLLGGPSVGKSRLMSDLFGALKRRNIHCEMVPEYAKELQYEGRIATTPQLHIITEQYMRQLRLQGRAQVVVTDAAVALSLVYADPEYRSELAHVMRTLTRSWKGVNVLLHRDLDRSEHYEQAGRYQNKAEAKAFHENKVVPFFREFFGPDLLELHADEALDHLVQLVVEQVSAEAVPA